MRTLIYIIILIFSINSLSSFANTEINKNLQSLEIALSNLNKLEKTKNYSNKKVKFINKSSFIIDRIINKKKKSNIQKNKKYLENTVQIKTKVVEQCLAIKSQMVSTSKDILNDLLSTIKKNQPLNGNQLDVVHRLIATFIGLNYSMFEKNLSYEPTTIFKNKKNQEEDLRWLTNHILMIDAFQNIFFPYFQFSTLRRLLDSADLLYKVKKHQFRKLLKKISSTRHVMAVQFALKRFNKTQIQSNKLTDYLKSEEVQALILNRKLFRKFRKNYFGKTLVDFVSNTGSLAIHHLSGAFGNSVGIFHSRKGYLLHQTEIYYDLLSKLKPLDVITEKTRFALTDVFIPGHFGHNAIWLGTQEQLKSIGMWNHPSIKPYQNKIKQGYVILEVLRSGTHLATLKEYMNIDEIAIIRIKNILNNKTKMFNIYRIAMGQIGKSYDFNFDVETTDKIVCSELLYQAFDFIHWPTKRIAGRFTITPDNVASNALYKGSPFELIYYIAGYKNKNVIKSKPEFANDLGFSYNQKEDLYQKKETTCKYKDLSKKSKFNHCVTNIQKLIYKGVTLLEQPSPTMNYSPIPKKIKYPRWMTRPSFY